MTMPYKEKSPVEDVLSSIRDVMSGKLTKGETPPKTHNTNEKSTLILTTALQEDGTIKELKNNHKEAAMTKTKTQSQPVSEVVNVQPQSPADMMISPQTVAESVAALSALSSTAPHNNFPQDPHHVGGRTIEELTQDILKPLLKEWLDSHLPSLVKWIVTEQIEKVIQQQQQLQGK